LITVPFAIFAVGAGLDALVGLSFIFVVGFLATGAFLVAARPLGRFGNFGVAIKRQRRPWRAAAGTAYSFSTGAALRMREPDRSFTHVVLFAALSGLGMFLLFGLLGRFVGEPPDHVEEVLPAERRPPERYRPIS
jgi:hypothetical protein